MIRPKFRKGYVKNFERLMFRMFMDIDEYQEEWI